MHRGGIFGAIEASFGRLSRAQIARPGVFLAACLLVSAVAGWLASHLELRTRFEQLLPERQPSVVELARLTANVPAGSHVFVVIEGGDVAAQRAFGDDLVERLRTIGPPWVVSAADGVHEARAFLAPRAGMFAKLEDLEKLRDDIDARWDWEVGKQAGLNIDDEEPPALGWEDVRKRFGAPAAEQFPDGYYQAKDGRALVVVADTAIATGDLAGAREALGKIRQAAEAVHAAPAHRSLEMSFAGDLVTGLAEYGAVKDDLVSVGALGVSLVLLVLFLYFMRTRALLALGSTIAVGLSWTFGLTYLFIGHLNVATGFLVSIVAGNGINFGIIYMARFFEERRRGLEAARAIETAHVKTWPSTLTAALAAAAAYGSLAVSEFRAFRHFAFIGAIGMLVCWVATYALLPPILLLIERRWPLGRRDRPAAPGAAVSRAARWFGGYREHGVAFGVPLAAMVARAPRAFAIGGLGLAAAGLVALFPYVRADPLEYDMRRMQNDLGASGQMYRASAIAADVLGAGIESAMVVLADRVDQVPMLEKVLEARRASAPADAKPFEAVRTLFDFVPDRQKEKIPVLEHIRERVVRAHERKMISEGDYAQIEPYLPPLHLAPWGLAELPGALARPFTDKAGVRGRLVLIEPTAGKNDSDLKYLMRWADSFREVPLPNGEVVRGSGRAVIFADMLKTVIHDIPPSVLLSFAMTVLSVVLTFRRGTHSLAAIGALLVGLGWVAFAMVAMHLKINFFNFIALPISFGIGVDYAVNLLQRYDADPAEGALGVLRSTGGAVILCSLTTMLGYLALLGSINQAIRSLGLLAVLGEVGCLLAAVLVLPAMLLWRERSAAAVRAALSPSAAGDRLARAAGGGPSAPEEEPSA